MTRSVPNNCVAAGVPAKVVRRDIAWERPHLTMTKPYYKPDATTLRKSPYWDLTAADVEAGDPPVAQRVRRFAGRVKRSVRRRLRTRG